MNEYTALTDAIAILTKAQREMLICPSNPAWTMLQHAKNILASQANTAMRGE